MQNAKRGDVRKAANEKKNKREGGPIAEPDGGPESEAGISGKEKLEEPAVVTGALGINFFHPGVFARLDVVFGGANELRPPAEKAVHNRGRVADAHADPKRKQRRDVLRFQPPIRVEPALGNHIENRNGN